MSLPTNDSLARDVIRKHSRSFSFASRLLPTDKRKDVESLYAWCRWCDDGVDTASSPNQAAEFVDLAIRDLQRIARGAVPLAKESLWFASLARRYDLPIEAAQSLLAGMKSDLTPAAEFDEDDLMRYCFRVAGAVGVLMCPILGLKDRRYLPHAASLGMGMQLTNIARDVAEDWEKSRCYLPVEWTDGLRPSASPPDRGRAKEGVRRALQSANGFYEAGDAGIQMLDRRCRLAVRAASRIYHAIGSEIQNMNHDMLDVRARVPFAKKLRLFAPLLITNGQATLRSHRAESMSRALATAERFLLEHGVSR
ncbi:MAG: phytoene/squalene synthase family protein [Planctomycetota bacterium]